MKALSTLSINSVLIHQRKPLQLFKVLNGSKLAGARNFSVLDDMVAKKQLHLITLPSLTDSHEAHISKWTKAVGESFEIDETICEITFPEFTIGYEAIQKGVLAKIIAKEGQIIQVNSPIAAYAVSQEIFENFQLKQAEEQKEDEKEKEKESKKSNSLAILKQIKSLIQNGDIEDGSDFAKQLQSLARKGNESLSDIFEASFDGNDLDPKTFDKKFFLENAQAVVTEVQSTSK